MSDKITHVIVNGVFIKLSKPIKIKNNKKKKAVGTITIKED